MPIVTIQLTPCSVTVGYHGFEGLCCLHLQGEDGGSEIRRNLDLNI